MSDDKARGEGVCLVHLDDGLDGELRGEVAARVVAGHV
jgi:hypothetical protein